MKNNKICWGIIGAGDVCEVKSVPAMYKHPDSVVKAVMRRNREKAMDFSRRHHIPYAYDNAEYILNDPEIDIVYVATPPSSHADYALKIARAGKAACIEKPMSDRYEDCIRMNEAFKSSGNPLFVAYYRRTLPNFLKVKEIVGSGILGDIRMVQIVMNKTISPSDLTESEINWRVDPEIAGGGYFYDLASHQLDFLDFLFGPVKKARGFSSNQAGLYKAEDIVIGSFEFENGIMGTGSWCFSTSGISRTDKTTIIGSKGQLEYVSFGDSLVRLETESEGVSEFRFDLPVHIQENFVNSIITELLGKGKCPSTGISASRTNRVLEEMTGRR